MLRILLAAALTAVSLCGCAVNKTNCHYYKLADCDKELSATVAIGKQLCFELEENITTGYSWQADYLKMSVCTLIKTGFCCTR